MNGARWVGVCCLFAAGLTHAQSSTSYRVQESILNSGGRPEGGQVAVSPNYRISLDSIGAGVGSRPASSGGFTLSSGFVRNYEPAVAVRGVHWGSSTDLAWDPQGSADTFRVFRGAVAGLGSTVAACLAGELTTAEYHESTVPAAGSSYFYLVAAANKLQEEGPVGWDSEGTARTVGASCP